jgi:hypothetical protein
MKYPNTVAPKEEDCEGDDVESMGGSQPRPRQTTPAKQEDKSLHWPMNDFQSEKCSFILLTFD